MSTQHPATISLHGRDGIKMEWGHDDAYVHLRVFRGVDHPNTIIAIDQTIDGDLTDVGVMLSPQERRALIAELCRQEGQQG